ncbi:MAG: ABC transporter permease [Erysipelotrichaceae bacterium]|nr:ABC transporter permease [Erysipelotrichaceae bacterium]MDY5251897.1 ABC transporter permease [Erysipelotrichaceae bacterium]
MNFLHRAIKNVLRRPTKSLLLALTFFVIGNLVIVGLGISSASENAKTLTRKQMRAVVSYEVDYNKFYEDGDKIENEDERTDFYRYPPKLDSEVITKMMNDERVATANSFSNWTTMYSTTATAIPNPYAGENNTGGVTITASGSEIPYTEPGFKIQANNYPSQIELYEGTYEIIEGRYYTQEEIDNASQVCLITDELAQANGLKIGDHIIFSQMDPSSNSDYAQRLGVPEEDLLLDVEIIGIFHNGNQLDPNDQSTQYRQTFEVPANVILMPSSAYNTFTYYTGKLYYDQYLEQMPPEDREEYITFEEHSAVVSTVVLLKDPLDVEKFEKDYQQYMGEYTKLNANNAEFKKLARPLDTMSFFANVVVSIVIFTAIVIITLVTALTMKTRSYEIGILLSLGVSKIKVVLQLFTELIIIAILGFSLSIASGYMIAGKVGDAVLEYQTATEDKYASDEDNFHYVDPNSYFTTISQDTLIEQYHVTIGALLIAEIYVVGLGVVFVSILIPSWMIMRFNPKQILINTY